MACTLVLWTKNVVGILLWFGIFWNYFALIGCNLPQKHRGKYRTICTTLFAFPMAVVLKTLIFATSVCCWFLKFIKCNFNEHLVACTAQAHSHSETGSSMTFLCRWFLTIRFKHYRSFCVVCVIRAVKLTVNPVWMPSYGANGNLASLANAISF